MSEKTEQPAIRLSEACWPVFEFVTNFVRQLKHGVALSPEQVRYEALSTLRDAEETARNDPVTERAWYDRIKAILVYLLDYKMLNTDWEGRNYWFDHTFETDPTVLGNIQSLGGEHFFETCDELQREYELAERRDRRDKDELAAQLNIYFTCLRLGFKGKYHGHAQELADYTRRLFSRLPSYASTRAGQLFPDAYKHNQEVKVNYRLGMSLTVVLATFFGIIIVAGIAFHFAWSSAVGNIENEAKVWREGLPQTSEPGSVSPVTLYETGVDQMLNFKC